MPSATAALVALMASSNASLRLFISASDGAPDADDRHAAGQLGQPLLELLAVVVAGRLLDLLAELAAAALDRRLVAGAADDRRVVLVDHDALGAAEIAGLDVLELDAELLGDAPAAGEDGDVLEHRLAAVAEAGRLDGDAAQRAAELVHDQRRQRLALDVLGDDQERTRPVRATCSSSGSRSFMTPIFLS